MTNSIIYPATEPEKELSTSRTELTLSDNHLEQSIPAESSEIFRHLRKFWLGESLIASSAESQINSEQNPEDHLQEIRKEIARLIQENQKDTENKPELSSNTNPAVTNLVSSASAPVTQPRQPHSFATQWLEKLSSFKLKKQTA